MATMKLTTYEPIVGVLVELSQEHEGWNLMIRHRHNAGRFGDCESERYERLTLGEAFDVLEASMLTLHEL